MFVDLQLLFILPIFSLSPAEFSIWTREAGAGGLSIAVEGPSRAEISFDDRKDGSCGVSYIAQEPGIEKTHSLHVGCTLMHLCHSELHSRILFSR